MRLEISLFLTILFLFNQQVLVSGAFQNCKPYKVIPVEDYDKDPSSARDTSKHPNGFYYGLAKYPGTSTNLQNDCVYMSNLTDRAVEVMVQPIVSGNKICVKDDSGNSECGETIGKCFEAKSDTVKYEFYCDPGKGCDSNVQFWYRLVPSQGDKDDWCTVIRSWDDFPNSLLPVPSKSPPNKDMPTAGSSVPLIFKIGMISVIGTMFLFCL